MRLPVLAPLLALSSLAGCQRDDLPATPQQLAIAELPFAPSLRLDQPPPPALPRDDPPVRLPRPARKRLASAVAENATCEACHDDIAKAWRGSYHQRANIDPAYRAAFAMEPSAFCRSCHAPEADPLEEPPEAVSALGVGCVTCHVTEAGVVLAAAHPDEQAELQQPAPHPLRRSHAFAHAGGCSGCHEFRFPMPGGNDDAFFMQTTVREHLRSPAAATPCADCHMPRRDGRRSHAFAEVRDAAWLRDSLEATAERTLDETLRVTLAQRNPGHDFPTGDLFRRLEIGYALLDEDGDVLYREARHLARHFEFIPGHPGRHLSRDDRVQSEPRSVELELPPPAEITAAARLSWWVSYQRVATVGEGSDPSDAIIESEVKLHSGSLPWHRKPPSADGP